MNAFTKISLSSALALTAVLLIGANSSVAASPKVVIAPQHGHYFQGPLPKFGFSSRTIRGLGEEVVRVRCHSIAKDLGLEPGDLILSLNEFRLTRCGDWHQALRDAMEYHNGCVALRVRDVRTGSIVIREICLYDPIGPITPKSQIVNRYSVPAIGPITTKSLGPQTLRSQKGNLKNFSNQNFQLKSAPKNNLPQESLQQQQLGNNFKNLSKLFKKD